jgi:flagellar hook-associated protein 2
MSSVSALNSLLSSSSTSAASSIDLSQILQAATGASSVGIDVTAAVNSAVSAAQAPETAWEAQQTTLQNQATALTKIQTDASNLDNDMFALNNITGPLSARTVASSNPSVVSATAASGAAVGNHTVVVTSLASTDTWASGVTADPVPTGSFVITTATGSTTIATGTGGSTTLSDVAKQINQDNIGVSASVVTDATGSRLAIVANNSGSASNFTVTGASGSAASIPMSEVGSGGSNAVLSVDGIPIQSASNTVTGALPGVTLNLLNTSAGANVSLSVAPDTTQASAAINQFVTDYNTAITDLNTQFTFSGSSEGVLATDSSVRSLQSTLEAAMSYTQAPGTGTTTTVPNLSSLGISVNNDGTLSVDSGTLTSMLQNNYSDVQNFFQGTALNGFANTMDQQLTSFISPSDGAFTLDLQSINTEYNDLSTDITNFQTNYIVPLQARLQADYSAAETALEQLPTETQQINTELGLNNSTQG